jgi:hypothetical protein
MTPTDIEKWTDAYRSMIGVMDAAFKEGPFPFPAKLDVSSAYAFVTVALWRLDQMRKDDVYYESFDNFLGFIERNFPLELIVIAMKTATNVHNLPMDDTRPHFKAMMNRCAKLILS